MNNNFLKQQIYENFLLRHNYINDIYLTKNVEKDYIIVKSYPENVTISCSLMSTEKNINDINFTINVDRKVATIPYQAHDNIVTSLTFCVTEIFNSNNNDKILDNFDVFLIKDQNKYQIQNEQVLSKFYFNYIKNNGNVLMSILPNGHVEVRDKKICCNVKNDNLIYYGGAKCDKNEINYEQVYAKFCINNNKIYKKLYKYSEINASFPGFLNSEIDTNFIKNCDILVQNVHDLNDFFRQGHLKICLKYKENLNQCYDKNETFKEYESYDVAYSSNGDAANIKFKIKLN